MSDETFRAYWQEVLAGRTPLNPRVPLPTPFVNRQGLIQNLMLDAGYAGVEVIECAPRTIRSNHWHQKDAHFLYVVSGSFLYYEQPVGKDGHVPHLPEPVVVSKRQMVYTGPRIVHATAFLEPTVLVSISKYPRDTKSHEEDLVRVPGWLTPEHLGWR